MTIFDADAIYRAGFQDGQRDGAIKYGEHLIWLLSERAAEKTETARKIIRNNIMKIKVRT